MRPPNATALLYLHLWAWAQLGVILRVQLGDLFGAACGSYEPWAPCITSSGNGRGGALFIDLPPNVLGCFIMGLLASTPQLAALHHHPLPDIGPVAALPVDSSLQRHVPLHIGLRTGLCGSLTTFASWMVQTVYMFVGRPNVHDSDWTAGLVSLFVGTALSLASLSAGQHAALALHNHLHTTKGPAAAPTPVVDGDSAVQAAPGSSSSSPTSSTATGRGGDDCTAITVATAADDDAAAVAAVAAVAADMDGLGQLEPLGQCKPPEQQQQQQQQGRLDRNAAAPPAAQKGPTPSPSGSHYALPCAAADALALAVLGLLTGISAWRLVVQRPDQQVSPFALYQLWIAVLIGPLGCLLRFHLACLNGKAPGRWGWFPFGTFVANIGACLLDFAMAAVLLSSSLQTPQGAMASAVMTGIGGCLSTVSTWVVEIQLMLSTVPTHNPGYFYMATSMGLSVVLGVLIYGIPAKVLF